MRTFLAVIMLVGLVGFDRPAHAGEIGFRYNGYVHTDGIFDLNPSGGGKILEATYTIEPIGGTYAKNVFIQGALGRYFREDFDSKSLWVIEASPGLQAQAGPIRVRLSQGVTIFNETGNYIQFGTHFGIEFISESGISIGVERTHYSNGVSGSNAGGYNLTGFTMGVQF